MKKSELKQLIRECVKELTEALEYKLDSALIKKIKPAILKSWSYIGSDYVEMVGGEEVKSYDAVEYILDSGPIASDDKYKEENDIIKQLIKKYDFKKVVTYISKNIKLG